MIRKATFDDIDSILEITKRCAKAMTDKGIFQWNEQYPNREVFNNDVESGELHVIDNKLEIIGCIVVSSLMDEEYIPINWSTPSHKNIYIHRLAINPKFQGQGFAKQLMDFAEHLAITKKCLSVRLDTFSQNHRNQKFYEQRGYKRLGDIYFPKQSEFPFYCYELIL